MIAGAFSCSGYRTLSVDVMQPAKVGIEPGIPIALMDRNIRVSDDIHHLLAKYGDIDRNNLFVEFVDGMRYVLEESNFSDTLVPLMFQEVTLHEKGFFPLPMEADTVKSLCRRFGVGYLAVLELQYYRTAGQQLNNNWLLRLYRADSGCPIDSLALCNHIGRHTDHTEEFLENVLAGAWEKGSEYARRIVPYWEPTGRRVYNGGKVLRLGDYYLREGNIDKAIEVWSAALKLSPKIAIRAAIDLAWIYENAGDFRQAAGILEEAEDLAESRELKNAAVDYLRKYVQVIHQRIEKSKVLDRQVAPQ